MADTAAPNAAPAAAPQTANADTAKPTEGNSSASTPKVEPVQAKPDNDLIKQLAKASAAERKANALVKEMQAKLEASTGSATEAQQKAAMLEEIKKNPRKLLDLGITWDNILESIQGKEPEPENPKLTALEQQLKELREEREREKQAKKDEEEKKTKSAHEQEIARGKEQIKSIVEKEGATIDAEGFPRWAIASQDPGNIDLVMQGIVDFVTEQYTKAKSEGKTFSITDAEAYELARQGMDQIEKKERAKLGPLLKIVRETSSVKDNKATAPTTPITAPRPELPPKRVTVDPAKPRKTIFPTTSGRG